MIDTKKQTSAEIVHILEGDTKLLFVLETGEGDFYTTDSSHIVPYDKRYFNI